MKKKFAGKGKIVTEQDIETLWKKIRMQIGGKELQNFEAKGLVMFAFNEDATAICAGGLLSQKGILNCMEYLSTIALWAKSQISDENPLSV